MLDLRTEIGIHAHDNLSLSVANSVVAIEEGVTRVDASLTGQGAGVGNCPIEAFVAVANLHHWTHGCDLFATPPTTSSARCRTARCASTARPSPSATPAPTPASCATPNAPPPGHGLDTRDVLLEVGRRRLVGGQEDMITDIALDLSQ